FSSRRRHTRFSRDWSSDVCSSDLADRRRLPGGRRFPGHCPGRCGGAVSETLTMLMLILNVVYVLVAIAMIVLILLQRGAGAAAGSGFGAGASGTVFGARGASNFLSK